MTIAARGLRNNNPLNLVRTEIGWDGKLPNNPQAVIAAGLEYDPQFEQFADVIRGVSSGYKQILAHFHRHGCDTIDKLARRHSATDQERYVAFVARSTGHDQSEVLNFRDPVILDATFVAMCKFENGAMPYSEGQRRKAMELAGVRIEPKPLGESRQVRTAQIATATTVVTGAASGLSQIQDVAYAVQSNVPLLQPVLDVFSNHPAWIWFAILVVVIAAFVWWRAKEHAEGVH
jgi:hypothetical protein